MNDEPRIPPLSPPYPPATLELLSKMTPPAAPEPLALFRALAHHPALAEAMRGLGGFLLGRRATLALRDREVVINRACARCGAEYEWGVHVSAFGAAAGLDAAQQAAIADPGSTLAALDPRDRTLVRLVDALHDRGQVDDELWAQVEAGWDAAQRIELLVLAGWYHAIAYVCTGARVPLEPWAARW
jgi:4-carboxymuconolactone decarboxylase